MVALGVPLGELTLRDLASAKRANADTVAAKKETKTHRNALFDRVFRSPSEITFVRNRMLYARAALNAKGGVRWGLRHIRMYYFLYYHPISAIFFHFYLPTDSLALIIYLSLPLNLCSYCSYAFLLYYCQKSATT